MVASASPVPFASLLLDPAIARPSAEPPDKAAEGPPQLQYACQHPPSTANACSASRHSLITRSREWAAGAWVLAGDEAGTK